MEAASPSEPARTVPMTGVDPLVFAQHNGSRYRTPIDLQVTPDSALRFLVVGGCLAEAFPPVASMINSAFRGDFVLVNNFDPLPDLPAAQASQYDFQIIHTPLRTILGNAFFHLPEDGSQHEEFLRQTQDYLLRYLSNVLRLNVEQKLLTFVLGFLVPQQNPRGRFEPRYDLRNIVHFVERLNMFLAAQVAQYQNAHFVDVDRSPAVSARNRARTTWSGPSRTEPRSAMETTITTSTGSSRPRRCSTIIPPAGSSSSRRSCTNSSPCTARCANRMR